MKTNKKKPSDTTFEPGLDEVLDEFDSDLETEYKDPGPMPIFDNIKNHVVSPFIQLTDSIIDDSD